MSLTAEDFNGIEKLVERVVGSAIDRRDLATNARVQEVVNEVVNGVVHREVGSLSDQISSFVEDNFTPAIDSLQEQIGEIRRDMKRMRVVVD